MIQNSSCGTASRPSRLGFLPVLRGVFSKGEPRGPSEDAAFSAGVEVLLSANREHVRAYWRSVEEGREFSGLMFTAFVLLSYAFGMALFLFFPA